MISRLPLEGLTDPKSGAEYSRIRYLNSVEIRYQLRNEPQQFVVADGGHKLEWVPLDRCFDFFKCEVIPHLAEDEPIYLEKFPDCYAYFASLWKGSSGKSVIVLEKCH